MTEKEKIISKIKSHHCELERFDVGRLALFGSVARSEEKTESDVDILVEFKNKNTKGYFDRFMELAFYLEDLLGRKVDLVTSAMIRPKMEPHIKKDAIYVA